MAPIRICLFKNVTLINGAFQGEAKGSGTLFKLRPMGQDSELYPRSFSSGQLGERQSRAEPLNGLGKGRQQPNIHLHRKMSITRHFSLWVSG